MNTDLADKISSVLFAKRSLTDLYSDIEEGDNIGESEPKGVKNISNNFNEISPKKCKYSDINNPSELKEGNGNPDAELKEGNGNPDVELKVEENEELLYLQKIRKESEFIDSKESDINTNTKKLNIKSKDSIHFKTQQLQLQTPISMNNSDSTDASMVDQRNAKLAFQNILNKIKKRSETNVIKQANNISPDRETPSLDNLKNPIYKRKELIRQLSNHKEVNNKQNSEKNINEEIEIKNQSENLQTEEFEHINNNQPTIEHNANDLKTEHDDTNDNNSDANDDSSSEEENEEDINMDEEHYSDNENEFVDNEAKEDEDDEEANNIDSELRDMDAKPDPQRWDAYLTNEDSANLSEQDDDSNEKFIKETNTNFPTINDILMRQNKKEMPLLDNAEIQTMAAKFVDDAALEDPDDILGRYHIGNDEPEMTKEEEIRLEAELRPFIDQNIDVEKDGEKKIRDRYILKRDLDEEEEKVLELRNKFIEGKRSIKHDNGLLQGQRTSLTTAFDIEDTYRPIARMDRMQRVIENIEFSTKTRKEPDFAKLLRQKEREEEQQEEVEEIVTEINPEETQLPEENTQSQDKNEIEVPDEVSFTNPRLRECQEELAELTAKIEPSPSPPPSFSNLKSLNYNGKQEKLKTRLELIRQNSLTGHSILDFDPKNNTPTRPPSAMCFSFSSISQTPPTPSPTANADVEFNFSKLTRSISHHEPSFLGRQLTKGHVEELNKKPKNDSSKWFFYTTNSDSQAGKTRSNSTRPLSRCNKSSNNKEKENQHPKKADFSSILQSAKFSSPKTSKMSNILFRSLNNDNRINRSSSSLE